MEKRMRKLERASKDLPAARTFGASRPAVGFITLGSTLGTVLEAMQRLEERNLPTGCLQLRTLWPFPEREVKEFLNACGEVFVVENNYSGELDTLMASQARPARKTRKICRYGTRMFTPQEIVEPVLRALERNA